MAGNRTNERLRPRGMRIRGRLLLLLAIPLTALLGITGYGVFYGATQWSGASKLQERTDLGLIAQELAADLQRERNLLVEHGGTDPELRERIEAADREVRERAERAGGSLAGHGAAAARRLDGIHGIARAELGGLVALRNYGLAVNELLDLAGEAMDPKGRIDDAEASTTEHLTRARAASSEEHDRLVHLTRSGELDAAGFQQLTALGSAQERYTELAASATTSPELQVRIERVGHQMRFADLIRRTALTRPEEARGEAWRDGLTERAAALDELHDDAGVLARSAVDDLATSSRLLLVTAALSAVAIVLVSAILLRRALRTIARPLQDLAVQAEDVARTRLPEAVAAQQQRGGEELHLPALRATGAAEVHEVAAAFNDVQDTALRLAGKQAALRVNQAEALTNLGRRNQTLLARQLDFISSLETRETDPAFLEHLFKLDHLASRMRRNAESLLILAGSETPRRRRTPAPVTEVVRAAMSEVEEFERVRIGHLRDATVAGPTVIDLVHLLAELIENALGFSPPETTVEIDGRSLGQGGYQFAIIDHGVGMTEVELIAANERMSGNDELEGMPTRYLGQYVVAKLATKIGAMVRLQHSSGGRGVTATVNLPAPAMLGTPDRSAVAGPLPGSRAAREQGPAPFAPGAGVSEAARLALPVDGDLVPASDFGAAEGDAWGSWAETETTSPTVALVDEDDAPSGDVSATAEDQLASDAELGGTDDWFVGVDDAWADTTEDRAGDAAADGDDLDPLGAPDVVRTFGGLPPVDVEAEVVEWPEVVPFEAAQFEAAESGAPRVESGWDAGEWVESGSIGGGPAVPPPAPREVPVQPDWQPGLDEPVVEQPVAEHAALEHPALEHSAVEQPVVDPVAGQAGFGVVEPADQPIAAVTGSGAPRSGGLTRRVPGASLAAREGADTDVAQGPPPQRSANDVKTMLSTFQAGRRRGRDEAPLASPPAGEETVGDDQQDWRSAT